MSEYRKTTANELFYVTLTTVGWIDVFSRDNYKQLLVENLRYCQQHEGLEIYAYVIMSNHLHLIAASRNKELSQLLGRFKGHTAKKIISMIESDTYESRREWLLYLFAWFAKGNKQYGKYHFWQYTNHPTLLYSQEVIMQKLNYIHQNPVRAGLVTEPEHYLYSSAHIAHHLELEVL
ncbi:MAG: transposase [Bacteroidia bacterium]|nr:transposase [Bacteroidia bacterium]